LLIDTEHQRTLQRESFAGFSFSKLRIDARHGGAPELFESAHDGAGDPFVVKSVYVLPEGLGGMSSWEDAWELLKEGGFTVAASEAAAANAQAGG